MNEKLVDGKLKFSGWAKLCLTMVNNAIDEGDVEFFMSEWGQTVLDGIELYYDNQHVVFDRDDILQRTKTNHRKLEYSARQAVPSIFDI